MSEWAPDRGVTASPFPPIAEYAFLSDCETCALVAPNGNVEWLCLPRFDSPSVFGAMLDRDGGGFQLGPADLEVPAARRYLPGTNVLETSWGTSGGWIIVRDVLLIGPWHHENDRSHTHTRAPTDYDADHVLLRMIRCVNGEIQVTMDCDPRFDYADKHGKWEFTGPGYHEAVCRADGCDVELRLTSDMNMGFEGPRATSRTLMHEGDKVFVALSWSEHPAPQTNDEAYERLVWTAHHWQHWLDHGTFPDHPWRTHLQRAALTLKGLSYAPTGALVAAATTSLPESPGGERNWDYRYSWIRDSTFMLWGLYTLGFDWEANDFFYFIADIADQHQDLQIMYAIDGEGEIPEFTLDHLSGYEGARPVRVGNGAYSQDQHDVWGALLDSMYLHTKSRNHLDDRVWPIVKHQVETMLKKWREPDRGIWEIRGEPKHFTSSKMMCWVAADRGARLAEMRGELEHAARWQSAADEIQADILENGVDERGVFVQHYDTDALDASLLLIVLTRFLPAGRRAGCEHGAGDRRRAHRGGHGPPLPRGRDRRRPLRRGGQLRDLLLLARVRARRDRRGPARPRPVRQAPLLREPPRPVCRGDRPALGPPPRQLPAGLHAPGPDQRGHARDPGRPGPGAGPPAAGARAQPRTFCERLSTSSPTRRETSIAM